MFIRMNIFFLQAEKKGASPSEYGLVFGIFELVVFIISPVYGQHVSTNIITVSIMIRNITQFQNFDIFKIFTLEDEIKFVQL